MTPGSRQLSRSLAAALAATVVVLLASGSVRAGANEWSSAGPVGGSITGLAVDPVELTQIFVSTDGGGIFRSLDSGSTWEAANNGQNGLNLTSLAMAPSDPETLYSLSASSGVYRTTDGGDFWTSWHDGLPSPNQVVELVVHPTNPDIVYAATQTGVYKTTAGDSADWTQVGSTATGYDAAHLSIRAIAHHPDAPLTVYAISGLNPSSGEQPVYATTDGGASWTRVNADATSATPTGGATTLVIDPEAPATMYAGTVSNGLWRTTDSGANWTQIANSGTTGVHTNRIDGIAIERLHPGGRVYVATPFGFSWAVDPPDAPDADDWTLSNPVNDALGVNTNAQVVALDPDNPDNVYGGTSNFGIWKSDDAAATWSEANVGLTATNIAGLGAAPSAPRTVYASMSFRGSGVVKSTDAGATWGRTKLARGARGIAVDPTDPDTVLVATDNGMYRTTDGGMTTAWASVNTGLPGSPPDVFSVAFDPANPDTAYAGLLSGGIYKSTNVSNADPDAVTWTAFNNGLPATLIRGFAFDPDDSSTVYARTNSGIFKSTSGGAWAAKTDGGLVVGAIDGLVVDPSDTDILYAGRFGAAGVYKSIDGGENWELANTDLSDTNVTGLVMDADDPSTLYASTSGGPGLFRSTNAAGTWEEFRDGLDNTAVSALAADAVNGAYLYAGTTGAGVFTHIVDAQAPTDVLLTGAALDEPFQLAREFDVSWTGDDAESGIASFLLEARVDNGPWVEEADTAETGPETVEAALGETICLRVTARDHADNSTTSPARCTAVPYDSTQLTHSRGWTKRNGAGYYENTYSRTTRRGATLRIELADVDRIALLATKCRGCGTLVVHLGSNRLATIRLAATSTRKKRLIQVADFDTPRDGLLRLRVTSSRKQVRIEGLGVLLDSA